MILEQESQLLAQIKEGDLSPVYLLYGEEQYLKELYCRKLQDCAVGDAFPEFNLHVFDGNKLDMEQVAAAAESMPFMAEQRCVVISPFNYGGLNSKDKEIFDSLLEAPVPTTVLILIVNDPDFLPKKNAKAKKLIAHVDHVGVVMELNKRSESDMAKFLQRKAKDCGCSISKELCQYLLERCEDDMLTLSNEIDKICAFAGAGEITKEQIDAVTVKAVSARIYDLAKAILAERSELAMSIVQELIYLRYQPTVILSSLSSAYLDLYIAKSALADGKGQAEIAKNFEYRGRDFVIRNSLRDCRKYSTEVLRRSIAYLAQTDLRMKSSRADSNILLEQCVAQLLMIVRE